ncbi:mitochondrial cytochrome c oxidase subunit 4, 13 kd [Dunaliella salina]|uniref:Mitochondrial cytochrome c oxidase subunit 4, 13 kd n=1 Tax=Dunaliella salina TaxID=3046 RepID=A0ABQ7G0V9_DUNSA|nr:mitochondrial cytochrome c oxidase subunit 4, 13 kd [Dunaliella salina]|eukprot:KAF5828238.1 mitochondrial cytochrome c oxidase subunit 4, 13 kd [Dunaliella salina]
MTGRGLARLLARSVAVARQRSSGGACLGSSSGALAQVSKMLLGPSSSSLAAPFQCRGLQASLSSGEEEVAPRTEAKPPSVEPPRKYRPLADKELWHEAWMYEDKFGTEDDPIWVWGILRANEPPRQFVEGGEFYVLNVVPYVTKVGDVMEQIEASKSAEQALEH